MPYRVVLTADAANDFRRLDGSLKEQVARQLKKLENSPHLGEHLGRKAGLNLTGYYKLYVPRNLSESIGKREDLGLSRGD